MVLKILLISNCISRKKETKRWREWEPRLSPDWERRVDVNAGDVTRNGRVGDMPYLAWPNRYLWLLENLQSLEKSGSTRGFKDTAGKKSVRVRIGCGEKFAHVAREKAVKLLDRGTGVISFTPVAREVWRYRWRLTRGHYDSFFTASRRVLKRRLLHEYNESNDASANYPRLFVILGS